MDVDPAPAPVGRAYTVKPDGLLDKLRERLQRLNGGQPCDLPAPPTLPVPASEGVLRVRGAAQKRVLLDATPNGDSFLCAAARELGVDEAAYCRAQRPAVVQALLLCSLDSIDAALSDPGVTRDMWMRRMLLPSTPFDAIALMVWSLLNATGVLVYGRQAADDKHFCAPIYLPEEPYEGLTVGLLDVSDGDDFPLHFPLAFAGFAPFRHVIAEVVAIRKAPCIHSFGQLSAAALNDSPAVAKAWIGMPKWKHTKTDPVQRYHGDIFIIGDGFRSTRMFRGSVNPLENCLHTSTVCAGPDGSPVFTVTAEDRPDAPLSGSNAGLPWKLCFERAKAALLALPPENRVGEKVPGNSDHNGKVYFCFTDETYLKKQEGKLDPDKRFKLYWETKQQVERGEAPKPTTVRRGRPAAAATVGAAGIDSMDAEPPAAKRPRRLSSSLLLAAAGCAGVAAGDANKPTPEQLAAHAPPRLDPSGADNVVVDLTGDTSDDDPEESQKCIDLTKDD